MVLRKPHPAPAVIREMLTYNPENGRLYWREREAKSLAWNKRWAGKEAGSEYDYDAIGIKIEGRIYYAEYLAFVLKAGRWPLVVTHRDGNRANNRWSNLQELRPKLGEMRYTPDVCVNPRRKPKRNHV